MKAGVALNPHTPVSVLEDIIQEIDVLLLMSVNPGFGGQSFIENTYKKVRQAKALITQAGANTLIEIDGGVTLSNAQALVEAGADALVVIGGDGSFTGALLFNQEFGFPVMGIPGTIDNDIYGTTYTLGYDTALNTVVEAIDKIRDTASSHNRMFFIEVMGRDAGFLALNSGIGGGAEKILIPEQHSTLEELVSEIEVNHNKGKMSNIIVVAEGDTTGKNVFELKKYVEKQNPDYDIRVTVLGHIQRGGAPTCFDRVLASRMGVKAVESLLEGKSNYMVGINNDKIDLTPLEKAIKGGESKLDPDLIRIAEIMSI